MKNYKNRSLSDVISTVGSMTLFLLFTGCLLMMIAVAAGTYSRISSNFDKTFGSSASLRYISNKLKSAEKVSVAENGKVLYLEDESIIDIIYFQNGALYENNFASDTEPTLSGGAKIFELTDISISEQGELFKITVTLNGEQNSTYVRR